MKTANALSLEALYDAYAHAAGQDEADHILAVVSERADLLLPVLLAFSLHQRTMILEEEAARLKAAMEPRSRLLPHIDAAERESARAQLRAVQRELKRRQDIRNAYVHAGIPGPPDSAAWLRADLAEAEIQRLALLYEKGTPWLRALEADTLSAAAEAGAAGLHGYRALAWILEKPSPSAVPLSEVIRPPFSLVDILRVEFLRANRIFGRGGADPVTSAAAEEVFCLSLAIDRLGDSTGIRLLDLPTADIVHMLLDAETALAEWRARRFPEREQRRYFVRSRREPIDLPEPNRQVQPETFCRAHAERGMFGLPLLYPLPLQRRERYERVHAIWMRGISSPAAEQIGVSLQSLPDDVCATWGVRPHAHGIFCTVRLSSSEVLTLGRREDAANQAFFDNLRREERYVSGGSASDQGGAGGLSSALRRLLRAQKPYLKAIAWYAEREEGPALLSSLTLLDSSPSVLLAIRESFPVPTPKIEARPAPQR